MQKFMNTAIISILLLVALNTAQAKTIVHDRYSLDEHSFVEMTLPDYKTIDINSYDILDTDIRDPELPEVSRLSLIAVGISLIGLRLRRRD